MVFYIKRVSVKLVKKEYQLLFRQNFLKIGVSIICMYTLYINKIKTVSSSLFYTLQTALKSRSQ